MNKWNIYKIIFVITFLTLFSFGLVEVVLAQNIPAQCWTQEQCLGQAGSETENYFFVVGDADFQRECKGSENIQYGKCYLKPDEINLSVPIPDIQSGGTLTKVSQFPDYLKVIYTYFIYVIGIITVAYIGWGGFEWMMAAGNAEKIGKAKDTIQGAFIGLLLAVGSYVLLGTINSRLVNIDYIRVERIKPNFLLNYCVDTESSQKWIKVGDESKTKVNKEDTWCNFTYYSEINPNNTCQGLKCGDGTYCLAKLNTSGSSNAGFECVDLSRFNERCKSQDTSSCELFDQYIQTISKSAPISTIQNFACRLEKQIFLGSDNLRKDECVYSTIILPEYANITIGGVDLNMLRIPCNQGRDVCMDGGNPNVLTRYLVYPTSWVDLACTDSPRATLRTDSICVNSINSYCSEEKPSIILDEYLLKILKYDWYEVDCSIKSPINNNNCTSKCWALIVNYNGDVIVN